MSVRVCNALWFRMSLGDGFLERLVSMSNVAVTFYFVSLAIFHSLPRSVCLSAGAASSCCGQKVGPVMVHLYIYCILYG